MEVFAIFLCIAIGHVIGDLQGVEIAKDELKAKEDAREGLPPYIKEAINPDQYLQSKDDAHVHTKSGISNETKTDEKPSSLGLGSPLDIPKHQEQQTGSVTIPQTDEARKPAVSHSIMRSLLDKHPEVLKSKILITDDAQKVGLENYVKSQNAPTKSLNFYNLAKKEGGTLNGLLTNTQIILPTKNSLQKGIEWNNARVHNKFGEFVHKPFAPMAPNEALTKDEVTTLEILLGDSGQSGASVDVETARLEETKKVKRTKRAVSKKRRARNAKAKKAKKPKPKPKQKPKQKPKPKPKQKPKQKAVGKGKKQVNKPRPRITEHQPVGPDGFNDPPVTCNIDVTLTQAQINEFLKAHNDARRREKGSNMLKLTWDPVAAKLAQQKANGCVRGHSMLKDCAGKDIGQSLFTSFTSDGHEYPVLNITQTTFMWADENKDWNYQTKTCNPGKQCGHWETLAAAAIRTVGCAAAKCLKMRVPATQSRANFVVCNYYPYYRGIKTFALGAPCSKCAKVAATTPEKGWTCENKLCAACNPRKKKGCKPASVDEEDL